MLFTAEVVVVVVAVVAAAAAVAPGSTVRESFGVPSTLGNYERKEEKRLRRKPRELEQLDERRVN